MGSNERTSSSGGSGSGAQPARSQLDWGRDRRVGGAGYANREVPESVFLSVKMVESNLTRVYRKLGVSTRRELARRIRSE
jgi:regulatory LuxR family protein